MTLLLVEVAAEALGRQPGVRVVGVVTPPEPTPAAEPASAPPAPRRWAGSLPAESAAAWDQHSRTIRDEWEQSV